MPLNDEERKRLIKVLDTHELVVGRRCSCGWSGMHLTYSEHVISEFDKEIIK